LQHNSPHSMGVSLVSQSRSKTIVVMSDWRSLASFCVDPGFIYTRKHVVDDAFLFWRQEKSDTPIEWGELCCKTGVFSVKRATVADYDQMPCLSYPKDEVFRMFYADCQKYLKERV